MEEKLAFPLQWPVGYVRTPSGKRIDSKFQQNMSRAQAELHNELKALKATDAIVSTNAPVRNDGMLYSDAMKRKSTEDPGVAVYFKRGGRQMVLCADQYKTIWENLYAIAKTINNLRAIDRWKVSDFLERAFTGFTALPEVTTGETDIWLILGLNVKPDNLKEVENAFKERAKKLHPDVAPGHEHEFQILVNAYAKAKLFFETKQLPSNH